MRAVSRTLVGLGLACTAALSAGTWAQDKGPAKILVITREFVKPGKQGALHDKAESAFVDAMTKAKWPTHYVAAASMSGKPRVLFFAGYDSYAAWEKDVTATDQNAVLSAALEKANQADGELLDSSDQAVFSYKEDLSFHTVSDLSHMRFLELWLVHIKRGHVKDWEEVGKTYRAAYEKAVPDAHWAMYEAVYGLPDNTYLLLVSRKSASELDRGPQDDKAVNAALGEEGAKKAGELLAACIESSESQFFYFNPKMSYPPDEWVKADPDFWRPKPAAPAAAKAEKKPSAD